MALLSVVVTIMNSATQLGRCLHALHRQTEAAPLEIIVPVFSELDGLTALKREWPAVRFIEIPDEPPPTRGFQHWRYDRRRAVGIASARGDIIAMTDEYAIPPERWCATLRERHLNSDADVVGGALGIRSLKPINRAAFLCDFARFEAPFEPRETEFASLVNVSYKRSELQKCKEQWCDLFDETVIHEHMRRAGARIFLDPAVAVDYDHGHLSLGSLLRGKYESGRTFAGRRIKAAAIHRRAAFAAGAVLLPPFLFARKLKATIASGERNRLIDFVSAAPFLALCLTAWSLGEFAGYVTGRPFPRDLPVRRFPVAV